MTRRRGPRALTPEDEEIWDKVARTAVPMHPRRRGPLVQTPPAAVPAVAEEAPRPARIPQFRLGESANPARGHDILPPFPDRLHGAPVRMDRRAYDQMKRGKLVPEARIDLHGLTLAQAHPELVRFVLAAHARGLRLLLVITGKGKPATDEGPIPVRTGALRHQVPHWLHMAPIGPLVLQVGPAHLRHGGGGAYYVYLRRRA